jgi:hypothetical protein
MYLLLFNPLVFNLRNLMVPFTLAMHHHPPHFRTGPGRRRRSRRDTR